MLKAIWQLHPTRGNAGFTLIELLLAAAIIVVLMAISGVILTRVVPKTSVHAAANTLATDIRQQQLMAMMGKGEVVTAYGVKVGPTNYTLFAGSSYNPTDPEASGFALAQGITVSTTFANDEIVFASRSGEVSNFGEGQNTLTVMQVQTGEELLLVINKLGVVTVVE